MLKGEQGKKLRRALIIAGAAAAVILLALLLRPEPVLMNSAGANDMLSMDVDADGRLTVADLAYICRAIMDNSVVFPRDAQNAAYSKDVK